MYGTLIQTQQLQRHLQSPNWLIFDCRFDLADPSRGESEYKIAHIPGAIYAHLDKRLSSPVSEQSGRHPMPDQATFIQWLVECGLSQASQVIVYDDSGGAMAARLWWLLKCMGHKAVALLDGGWQAWQAQQGGVDDNPPALQAGDFDARLNDQCIVSCHAVMNNLASREFVLVDVRTAERFSGEAEPIDPVAGHIPGAVNMPLSNNLDEHGFFKSAQQLKAIYSPLCDLWPADRQVYMCGSGVTACHTVLAMAIAGLGFPRVYAGSWSEWIRDPGRPVATGVDEVE